MRIHKEYRKLENVEEVNVYDVHEKEFYIQAPKEFEMEKIPFPIVMKNIKTDINIFVPYKDGEDFIIHGLGNSALKRGNIQQEDIEGRLLSKASPMFHQLLHEALFEVYKTHEIKHVRFLYHHKEKLARLTNVKIIYEMGRIFILSDHIDTSESTLYIPEDENRDEDKANLIEYFAQTGSYYKINGKYSWTQGIYNIINRPRDEYDEYYNIIFDLTIPEDKPLIEKINKIMDSGTSHYESIIRIRTHDGTLKYLEMNLYSKFDNNGNLISRYGLIKDVTTYSHKKITRPVDFLLSGFKNSKKLALLIEPLNPKQYEFSKGFYHLIEEDPEEYSHSRAVIQNIVEEDVINNIIQLIDGQINELEETFTYNVKGNENNQKICEIYLERFEFGSDTHSIGFLTDVTEERTKQLELMEANEHQNVLIKEVHHRVKNNLQVLNSFLNLEKRAYKDKPSIIIDHMQSRLSSLAILHEKTYNTTDFKNINLKEYIEDQDGQLRSLIGLRDGIEFESEVDEDLVLTIEVITPLLLVIDELTMNAIKHAFPDKSKPNKKITKKITKIDNENAELILQDNGVGINDPDKITKNLGCEIIKNLTKQLDGHIELFEHEHGTGYKLTFPIYMDHTIEG